MNANELARIKNIDLTIGEYNNGVDAINDKGFIDNNSPEVKKLKLKYESIIARFDTNIHVHKKDGKYVMKEELHNKTIKGIRGLNKTKYIECGV